jgi:hypothetical protein
MTMSARIAIMTGASDTIGDAMTRGLANAGLAVVATGHKNYSNVERSAEHFIRQRVRLLPSGQMCPMSMKPITVISPYVSSWRGRRRTQRNTRGNLWNLAFKRHKRLMRPSLPVFLCRRLFGADPLQTLPSPQHPRIYYGRIIKTAHTLRQDLGRSPS